MYAVECYNNISGNWDVWAKLQSRTSANMKAAEWRAKYGHMKYRVVDIHSSASPVVGQCSQPSATTPADPTPPPTVSGSQ